MINKCKVFFSVLLLSCVLLVTIPAKPAYACEQVVSAIASVKAYWDSAVSKVMKYVSQAKTYIEKNFLSAQRELVKRMTEFDENLREAIGSDFWNLQFPSMKFQTMQWHVADIDQSRTLCSFLDAKSQTNNQRDMKERESEAHRRFRVSDQSCQAESMKETLVETEELTNSISAALNVGERHRQGSRIGSISEDGQEAEQDFLYNEANANFCMAGQVGCVASGPSPMGHILNANFYNGATMSHDMTSPIVGQRNRLLMDRLMSNFTGPVSPNPISVGAVDDDAVKEEILFMRNPALARRSLLNYIMGKQLGASVAGNSNIEVSASRTGSSINPANASLNPSKREIKEAMRERILSNAFVMGIITEPEDLLRRQATMKEQQMRTWLQIKDINEDRLALIAMMLGQDLSNDRVGDADEMIIKQR